MKSSKSFSWKWWAVLFVIVALSGSAVYFLRNRQPADAINSFFIDDTLFAKEIADAAVRYGLPPELVRAVIRKESKFRSAIRGKAGEIGLMQILPEGAGAEWARINKRRMYYPHEMFNPVVNLDIGCWYLARALNRWRDYRCAVELALAEYNAGIKNVSRWKPDDVNADVIPRIDFPGTRKYVTEIMFWYQQYLSEAKEKTQK